MKLIQFIRPLFLVALGLHGLILFLPLGEESEVAIVDDLSFSEEPDLLESASDNLLESQSSPQAPEQLPISNPDALVIASRKAAAQPNTTRASVPTQTAVRRPSPSPNRSPNSVANRASSRSAESAANDSQSSEDGSANITATQTPIANTTRPRRPPTNNIPDLSETVSNSLLNDSQSATSVDVDNSPSVADLVAKLTNPISDSRLNSLLDQISDLAKSLTYSEENTDDSSANQNRASWKADIQKQANVGAVESITPTEIADLTEVTYPIESPKQAGMQARSLSLCLEEEPHDAEVGVRFDSQGNVADEPFLIRSTGYSALNDEIIATVASYQDFPPSRHSKAYLLEFKVDYDAEACVSLEELKE
ncbi:hypothetical protein S7335_2108 [Synechococcus sp. PCC 7335]|uniref:energy transducer TonB n=1 Tax=Synechococcus sp. (strain ATCC 29403 / PCC 7335) TaxID=91464 RepID=UPI00017EB444|nr:hypothetical protein [Synechococcus sp. PCC 7335]EDX84411.1 hypothetical protein S7335_2108 [Synechococcus sp. PCC 7335]